MADRIKTWTIEVPNDPELRAIFGEAIQLDNLGGVTIQSQRPALLDLQLLHREALMMHPLFIREKTLVYVQIKEAR